MWRPNLRSEVTFQFHFSNLRQTLPAAPQNWIKLIHEAGVKSYINIHLMEKKKKNREKWLQQPSSSHIGLFILSDIDHGHPYMCK